MPKRLVENRVFEALARLGWMVKGVVFATIGYLGFRTLAGEVGDDADVQGAIAALSDEPFGGILLWLIALGLLSYGLWRLAVGIFDLEDYGGGLRGIGRRLGFGAVGVFYGFLSAWLTTKLLAGDDPGSNGEDATVWAARVLEAPAGPVLLAIAALGTAAVGVFQIWRAYQAPYEEQFAEEQMSAFSNRVGRWIGRVGVGSRGIAFGAIAFFLARTALEEQPEEARDLGETFLALADAPVLLVVISIGFMAYGFHCLLNARYRDVTGEQRPPDEKK